VQYQGFVNNPVETLCLPVAGRVFDGIVNNVDAQFSAG